MWIVIFQPSEDRYLMASLAPSIGSSSLYSGYELFLATVLSKSTVKISTPELEQMIEHYKKEVKKLSN